MVGPCQAFSPSRFPHGIWGGCVWKGRRVPNQTLWSLPGRLENFTNTFRLENFYFFFISSPEEILFGEDAMLCRPCSAGNPWVLVGLNLPRLYSVVIRMRLYYLPVPQISFSAHCTSFLVILTYLNFPCELVVRQAAKPRAQKRGEIFSILSAHCAFFHSTGNR